MDGQQLLPEPVPRAWLRVITGVDSGMAPAKQHGNVWRVVGEMVQAGYSPAGALAAATSVTADACGLCGVTGRLAKGHAADVLVVDGDLSRDVSALSRPVAVLISGVQVRAEVETGEPSESSKGPRSPTRSEP